MLKSDLTACEVGFTKYKSLVKRLFLEIKTDLLEMTSPDDSELPMVVVSIVNEDSKGPSQIRNDSPPEVHD